MGQRNMVYTGPMNENEIEHAQIHPEPCVIPFGRITNFPQAANSHGPLPSGITFMAAPPPAAARAVPVPISHGLHNHNQLAFPTHQVINGFHGAFKGKTAEGFPVNFQYFYPMVPDYNIVPVVMGPTHHRGARNRAIEHNPGMQFMPMSHGGQAHGQGQGQGQVQSQAQPPQVVPAGPWFDQQFCTNAPGIPFIPGYTNGYQVMTAANRNPVAFVHPLPPPMPPLRGSVDFHPLQNGFVSPAAPPVGVRVFHPHRQELTFESTTRQRGFPQFRVLPEDGVAMLDYANYGRRVDHHRDMRLDIDHMSYEELLALGEQIGNAGSGLSENFILGHLKTRTFTSSPDQELTFCTICQMNYDDHDKIGTLDCSHEYHVDCINKWLLEKNSCPICKCTALATTQGKESGNPENS